MTRPEWYRFGSLFWDAIRDFTCATPVSAETMYAEPWGESYILPWEKEVQVGFNEAEVFFNPDQDNILLLAADVDWDCDKDPTIYGIVWVSVTEGQWKDPFGRFHISFIARSYRYRRCGTGDHLLTQALRVCWDNHKLSGRPLEVTASIDYRNTPSIRLFERHDFRQIDYDGAYIIYALPSNSREWNRIEKTF